MDFFVIDDNSEFSMFMWFVVIVEGLVRGIYKGICYLCVVFIVFVIVDVDIFVCSFSKCFFLCLCFGKRVVLCCYFV